MNHIICMNLDIELVSVKYLLRFSINKDDGTFFILVLFCILF